MTPMNIQAQKRIPLDSFNKVKELYENQIEKQYNKKIELTDNQIIELAFCHVLGYETELKINVFKKKCKIIKKVI